MSFFTLQNGEKLYYEITGEGEHTVLMLHGWTSTHEVFEPVLPAICEKVRCITYDQRGHGNSKDANREHVTMDTLASDLDELIRGLDLHDITLLGWSMGAGVCLNYMSVYGCDALREVVLCDMTPMQLNDENWKLGLYQGKYTREDMERGAGRDFYSTYKEFSIGAIPKLAKIPGFLLKKPLMKRLSACDEGVLRSLGTDMKVEDYRESVEKITVPVCYFYAVPGSLYSPALAQWYSEHVRTAYRAVPFQKRHVRTAYRAVPFQNSTHMLITDHPDEFAQELIKVIEGRAFS